MGSQDACMRKCFHTPPCVLFYFLKKTKSCQLMKIKLVKRKGKIGIAGMMPYNPFVTPTTQAPPPMTTTPSPATTSETANSTTSTSTTSTTSTTTSTTTAANECNDYSVLDDSTRNINHG